MRKPGAELVQDRESEKIERDIDFLPIVTEVDLAASRLSFALPSRLTNVAVLSTKRPDPPKAGGADSLRASPDRLAALMAYSFGRIVNLSRVNDPGDVMHDFHAVEALDAMATLTPAQRETVVRNLPVEARERVSERGEGTARFILRALAIDLRGIGAGILRANPLRQPARGTEPRRRAGVLVARGRADRARARGGAARRGDRRGAGPLPEGAVPRGVPRSVNRRGRCRRCCSRRRDPRPGSAIWTCTAVSARRPSPRSSPAPVPAPATGGPSGCARTTASPSRRTMRPATPATRAARSPAGIAALWATSASCTCASRSAR